MSVDAVRIELTATSIWEPAIPTVSAPTFVKSAPAPSDGVKLLNGTRKSVEVATGGSAVENVLALAASVMTLSASVPGRSFWPTVTTNASVLPPEVTSTPPSPVASTALDAGSPSGPSYASSASPVVEAPTLNVN